MKSEKGVTLISLIATVIAMCLTLSMLSMISSLFFKNTQYLLEDSEEIAEYNKFAMYFLEDIKNNKSAILRNVNEIEFEDGTIYTFKKDPDSSIYRNKVKICTGVVYCTFTINEEEVNNTTKKIVKVYMIMNPSRPIEISNEFVLKYW